MIALLTITRRMANLTNLCRREPTIVEILSDPIVQTVMEADGVDPKRLETLLRSMAQELAASARSLTR
jgi:hypothetical protein